jgi:WhiB family redox-sensing transcriptional regulator
MRGTRTTDTATDTDTDTPCATADPDLWFAERPAELNLAKSFCGPCPLRAACLAGALARREPWGVWGGEIVVDGVVLAYKRGRGRPSNADRRRGLYSRVAASGEPAFTRRDRTGTCRSRSA